MYSNQELVIPPCTVPLLGCSLSHCILLLCKLCSLFVPSMHVWAWISMLNKCTWGFFHWVDKPQWHLFPASFRGLGNTCFFCGYEEWRWTVYSTVGGLWCNKWSSQTVIIYLSPLLHPNFVGLFLQITNCLYLIKVWFYFVWAPLVSELAVWRWLEPFGTIWWLIGWVSGTFSFVAFSCKMIHDTTAQAFFAISFAFLQLVTVSTPVAYSATVSPVPFPWSWWYNILVVSSLVLQFVNIFPLLHLKNWVLLSLGAVSYVEVGFDSSFISVAI